MSAINVQVDVCCTRPSWVFAEHLKDEQFDVSIYRLYANHDLLTERTWIWDNETVIRENIWLFDNCKHYSIKLFPILKNAAQAKFSLKNFVVVDAEHTVLNHDRTTLTFELA